MQNTNNVSREESTRRGTTILFTCEGFTLITRVKISRVINADGLVGHTHPNLPRVNNGKIRLDEEDLYTLFIGHTIGEGTPPRQLVVCVYFMWYTLIGDSGLIRCLLNQSVSIVLVAPTSSSSEMRRLTL